MKTSHWLQSRDAGPAWGLALGVFLIAVGVALRIWAKASQPTSQLDEALAFAAALAGLFLAAYTGREIHRQKHR